MSRCAPSRKKPSLRLKTYAGNFCCLLRLSRNPATTSTKVIIKSPGQFGFWIADLRLSETDSEKNAFISLFSWLSIQDTLASFSFSFLLEFLQERKIQHLLWFETHAGEIFVLLQHILDRLDRDQRKSGSHFHVNVACFF